MLRKLISLSLVAVMLSVTAFAATDISDMQASYAEVASTGTIAVEGGKLFINGYGLQGTLSLTSPKDTKAKVVAAVFDESGNFESASISEEIELTADTATSYPVTIEMSEAEAKKSSVEFYLWEKDTIVPLAGSVSATTTYGWSGKEAANAPAVATAEDLDGTYEGYYMIKSPEDLAWFAKAVQGGNNTANAVLCNDIYLNGFLDEDGSAMTELGKWYDDPAKLAVAKRWWNGDSSNYSIGNKTYKYGGVFDGNGKTVHGLYIVGSATNSYFAMFSYVDGATIKDLTIAEPYHVSKANNAASRSAGILVGCSATTESADISTNISNITVSGGKVTAGGSTNYVPYIGSIVAHAFGGTMNVTNCTSSLTVDFSNAMPYNNTSNVNMGAGGIVGMMKSGTTYKLTIDGCSFTGHVNLCEGNNKKFGGILGQGTDGSSKKAYAIVKNCTGSFTTTSEDYVNELVGIGSNYTASDNNVTYTVVGE